MLVLVSTGFLFTGDFASASDETKDLQTAVHKLNFWIVDSSESEGWRRFLLLNELESQAAMGNQASIEVLESILSRFSADETGLNHPVFQKTKAAIEKQIKRLKLSRSKNIPSLVSDSRYQFFSANPGTFSSQRSEAIDNLETLRRYYRATMPSRKRANLFYDMQLNPMIEFLSELEFEPAPEVSVGKIDSMIRDVQSEIRDVVEKIDAMPLTPMPDNDDQDDESNDNDSFQLSSPTQDLPNQILIGEGPSEDEGEETSEELEKQKELLEEKRKTLIKQRREVLKADRPRLQKRAANVRQLRKFEQRLGEVQKDFGDPYFATAKASLEELSRGYFYGTSGNLQEDMLSRVESIQEQLEKIDSNRDVRTATGELGDALRWLDAAGQAKPLVTAIRTRHSTPNGYISVSSGLVNRLASQPLSDRQPIRQTVFGRLVRGCADTNGNVSVQFFDNPNQIHARIRLDANIQSSTYLQERKIQVFTSSSGVVQAQRDIFANVGGIFWNAPEAAANFQSTLTGTNSKLRLVNNIVNKQFFKAKPKADGFAAQQAKEQAAEQFADQTEEPLLKARDGLASGLKNTLNKTRWLPAVYLRSTYDRIHAVVKHETDATLAAPNPPQEFGVAPEVTIRIHETLLSNYLDEIFKGKTFTNEELAEEFADLTGEMPPGLTGENAEGDAAESFTITFARVRPIQFEFVDQKIRVVVAGRKFAQGDQKIDAGLKIILQFKIVDENGDLKLKRDGKVDFEFIDPDRTTPKLVAFRRFLDERLNDQMESEDTETILPSNLLPVDEVAALADSPVARKLRLVQFRLDGGWAYLGWNHEASPASPSSWIYDLSAIGRE